jgi:translocation and assembly module TamB
MRILRNVGIGFAAFLIALAVAGILVVRTQWFRNYVREKVVMALAEGTGGRVEIGSFSFDWTHLSAAVANLVIHGSEPAGSPPYLSARRVEVHVRLFTSIHHLWDITYLGVEQPQATILVGADGSTNVPVPKQPAPSNSGKKPLRTVVDLAVGRCDLSNGSVTFNSRKQDFDLRAESLHVQLWYDVLKQGYKGEVSLAPLYVASGRNTPVKFRLSLPVTLNSDRIAFQNATVETDRTQLVIDGSLENLNDPKASAHIRGHVALADLKNAANLQIALDTRGMPPSLELDVNATAGSHEIDVTDSRLAYGASSIHASGILQDPAGHGSLQFQVQLALAELGRLAKLDMQPEGTFQAKGSATMDARRDYDVRALVDTQGLSFRQGAQRIRHVTLNAEAHLTPHRLDLSGLRIGAFGAEIAGAASLEDLARYSVNVTLSHLDVQKLMREMGQKGLGYGGTVSGPLAAAGDLSVPGTRSLTANAHLSIAPDRDGVPLSGRIAADYHGDSDNLTVSDSYVALPHSRLNLSGSIGNHLSVVFTTTDLGDFNPLTGGNPPVVLRGPASFTGAVTGRLSSPQIAGHLAVGRFAAEGRQFHELSGDVAASSSRAALTGGCVRRGNMQTQLSASLGLQNWTPTPNQPVSVQASVRNGDLADAMALAGTDPQGYSGALAADVNISGTIGDPSGAANFTVANGTIHGEPVDRAQARINMADRWITVTNAEVVAGQSRVDLTAGFHHPRDRFDRGEIHAHLQSNQVDLSKLRAVQNLRPDSGGTLQVTADLTGQLDDSFVPTNVTADISGRGLRAEGQNYGDFTAAARTTGQNVTYNVTSDFAGSQIRVNGNTSLAAGYRTTADANIAALPIERVLHLLRRADIPAKGTLTATAHFTGTMDHPEGTLEATVDHGVFEDEPIDRVHARVTYLAASIDVPQLEVRAGKSGLDATVHFDHQPGVLTAGEVQFRVSDGHADLAHIRNVQKVRPGIAGTVRLSADGAATLNSASQLAPRSVNVNFSAKGLAVQGKNLGDLTLDASTSGGRVNFTLDSSLGGASIQGKGNSQLAGDYPTTAQITIHNVTWKGLQPLLGPAGVDSPDFDAAADGEITMNGPVLRSDAMSARLQLSRVQLTAATPGIHSETVTVQNQGPVAVSLDRGVARIESLHLTGPKTDVQAQGSVSLTAHTLQASLNARTDLGLLQKFDRDVVSSGQITADATLRGTFANPLINGKLQLQNASVNLPDVPTGLSNANGVVDFNGTSASFQNMTGEVGGGKVTLSGFVAYSGATRMALRVNANNVHVRLQPGVSAAANADLHLSGRMDSSIASGTVTINQITYAPQSDLGAILSRAAPAVQSPPSPSLLLDNMRLDVQVRTSSGLAVRASVAQGLQMDANLHVQGTASQPGVTGRVAISEGKLAFMGSTYAVNTGTITFYNPIRIDPILDLSLETQAQGVDVTLKVTGPIDNMKLSYTSNPPLQFQEVVGLLAAGQTPTSDPTILANQPTQPPQSFQEMGESAVVGQALADPIANQMQRVFGLTQFKIDPTFANGQDLPQAQISVQQQVTSRITLTYSTPVQSGGEQAVSGQYLISPDWSATATRDQFGLFSVKLMYKKQLK